MGTGFRHHIEHGSAADGKRLRGLLWVMLLLGWVEIGMIFHDLFCQACRP